MRSHKNNTAYLFLQLGESLRLDWRDDGLLQPLSVFVRCDGGRTLVHILSVGVVPSSQEVHTRKTHASNAGKDCDVTKERRLLLRCPRAMLSKNCFLRQQKELSFESTSTKESPGTNRFLRMLAGPFVRSTRPRGD